MRILVTGSRGWTSTEIIRNIFLRYDSSCPPTLVHGACPKGADAIADRVAKSLGWGIEAYPAQWEKYGKKKAGPIRNAQMVDTSPDLVLAFPTESSVGTIHCMNYAIKKNIPTIVISETGEETVNEPEHTLFD